MKIGDRVRVIAYPEASKAAIILNGKEGTVVGTMGVKVQYFCVLVDDCPSGNGPNNDWLMLPNEIELIDCCDGTLENMCPDCEAFNFQM